MADPRRIAITINPMLHKYLRAVVSHLPGISRVFRHRDQLMEELAGSERLMRFRPGHYYSPVASKEEISERFSRLPHQSLSDLPGVDLNIECQKEWSRRIASYYSEQFFPILQTSESRYYFENEAFTYADALFLFGMLRALRPRRIIEVGSGFSSALMMDVNDRFYGGDVELTFIEPFPDRLYQLLSNVDRQTCRIIERRIQDVENTPWSSLGSGDILFVDSSHVSKCGSDVNFLFFEVLPSLSKDVVVHIHDVFPHFEYLESWHREGRSWNEAYLLRAFLQFNPCFEIMAWVPYLMETDRDYFETNMPLCLRNTGGSLWMRKIA